MRDARRWDRLHKRPRCGQEEIAPGFSRGNTGARKRARVAGDRAPEVPSNGDFRMRRNACHTATTRSTPRGVLDEGPHTTDRCRARRTALSICRRHPPRAERETPQRQRRRGSPPSPHFHAADSTHRGDRRQSEGMQLEMDPRHISGTSAFRMATRLRRIQRQPLTTGDRIHAPLEPTRHPGRRTVPMDVNVCRPHTRALLAGNVFPRLSAAAEAGGYSLSPATRADPPLRGGLICVCLAGGCALSPAGHPLMSLRDDLPAVPRKGQTPVARYAGRRRRV